MKHNDTIKKQWTQSKIETVPGELFCQTENSGN